MIDSKGSGNEFIAGENMTDWISHRGYCKEAVENTRKSFDAALTMGFLSIETDLRITKDNHIVLAHDQDFQRLGGPSTPIAQLERKAIENIQLRDGSSPLFFDEFIDAYAGCQWTFDIKPESGEQVIAALAKWSHKMGAKEWLLSQGRFLFWNDGQQAAFLEHFPKAHIYASAKECWRAGLASMIRFPMFSPVSKGRTYSIPSSAFGVKLFTRATAGFYHARGAKILAYLPETDELALLAEACGFDEILTNGPFLGSQKLRTGT